MIFLSLNLRRVGNFNGRYFCIGKPSYLSSVLWLLRIFEFVVLMSINMHVLYMEDKGFRHASLFLLYVDFDFSSIIMTVKFKRSRYG